MLGTVLWSLVPEPIHCVPMTGCRINSLQFYEVTYIAFSLGQDIQCVPADRHYLRGINPSISTLQFVVYRVFTFYAANPLAVWHGEFCTLRYLLCFHLMDNFIG
jgi:hypothetical protein